MAKDPAFLFYSNDFLAGTYTMSDMQVGQYIRLMCLQHQTGHLSESDMLSICKEQDKAIWRKFQQDDEGLYFNERLELETNKRNKFTESRRTNANSKKESICPSICTAYASAKQEHMENENSNTDNTSNIFIKPTAEEVTKYCTERKNNIDGQAFIDFYESKGWMIGKNHMKVWKAAVRTWEKHNRGSGNNGTIRTNAEPSRWGNLGGIEV